MINDLGITKRRYDISEFSIEKVIENSFEYTKDFIMGAFIGTLFCNEAYSTYLEFLNPYSRYKSLLMSVFSVYSKEHKYDSGFNKHWTKDYVYMINRDA